jgi:hypothetical protein
MSNSRFETRRANREKRDEQLNQQFKQLYEVERIRLDDCIDKLATQYCLSKQTVERILWNGKKMPPMNLEKC